jgi:hypothetical protein
MNFPAYYGNRWFIAVCTRALHWSLSSARSIQSTPPHSLPLRSILILSTRIRLGPPSGLFPSGSSPHICYMPCPPHPPSFDQYNYTWRGVHVMKLLIMQFFPSMYGCETWSLTLRQERRLWVFRRIFWSEEG